MAAMKIRTEAVELMKQGRGYIHDCSLSNWNPYKGGYIYIVEKRIDCFGDTILHVTRKRADNPDSSGIAFRIEFDSNGRTTFNGTLAAEKRLIASF